MPFLSSSTDASPSPEGVWATAFNEIDQRIRPSFVRRAHQAVARLCHYKRRYTLAGHLQL